MDTWTFVQAYAFSLLFQQTVHPVLHYTVCVFTCQTIITLHVDLHSRTSKGSYIVSYRGPSSWDLPIYDDVTGTPQSSLSLWKTRILALVSNPWEGYRWAKFIFSESCSLKCYCVICRLRFLKFQFRLQYVLIGICYESIQNMLCG